MGPVAAFVTAMTGVHRALDEATPHTYLTLPLVSSKAQRVGSGMPDLRTPVIHCAQCHSASAVGAEGSATG